MDQGMNDLVSRYKEKLTQQFGTDGTDSAGQSREYKQFKAEAYPAHFSTYEKLCKFAGKLLNVKLKPEMEAAYQESINTAHLNITPKDAYLFSIFYPMAYLLIGGMTSMLVFDSMFFTAFFAMSGLAFIPMAQKIPDLIANSWRMKASNQMVLCVFYVVTYMRHTSNLELAIAFSSEHLSVPLSLDMRKLIWDVETEKFDTIKDALDAYLETWKKYNGEFIDSMHLIESSLFESAEDRRIALLDKSLDVMLEGTFEKMLHYAQNLKAPITMLHMLGVILPILGLVILPMVVSFMEGISWYHIAVLYNIILPGIVFYMGKKILSNRPTGYGDVDVSELNPELAKFKNVFLKVGSKEVMMNPAILATFIGALLFFAGLIPVFIHIIHPEPEFDQKNLFGTGLKLLDYKNSSKDANLIIGPYGFGASAISLLIPLAFAIGFGMYFRFRTKYLIEIRDRTKKLEAEFASALFQLANRLGDGLPAEIAFQKVADVMEDTLSGQFFKLVTANIRKLGMGVKDAIFNPKTGAITNFPSNVILSSMKVLVESVKKGPLIAAQALSNVSRYIKEIHKVNERLKDLMAETISDMTSQINFLTPMISGIVIGITSMITTIMGSLRDQIQTQGGEDFARVASIVQLFGDGIPTYFFQLVVGVYVFEIIYVLTVLSNGIQNGADKLSEQETLARNLIKSTTMYCLIAFAVMLTFNIIALRMVQKIPGAT